jgi:hypothetical protein
VGHKSVAAACDVAATVLSEVLWGGKKRIRRHTADRVLAVTVDAAADGARIDARPTWRLIAEMLEAGLTKTAISRGIGHEQAVLCIGRELVEAKTALKVRQLHARVMAQGERGRFPRDPADPRFVHPAALAEVLEQLHDLGVHRGALKRHLGYVLVRPRCTPPTFRKLQEMRDRIRHQAEIDERAEQLRKLEEAQGSRAPRVCPDCGASHAKEARLEVILRMLPCPGEELRAAHPCWWTGVNGDARLSRDLRAVGAVKGNGVWLRAERPAVPAIQQEAPAA